MKPNPRGTQIVLRLMAIASLIVMMLALAGPVGAAPDCTELRCGQAVVDGNYSEWSVPGNFTDWDDSEDFLAYMYRAYDSGKPKESALFMRYDLPTQTAYVLVLAKPGVPGIKSAADAWVSISNTSGNINNKVVTGNSGDDGVPPDFAWVGVGYDGDLTHVQGFEASFSLAPTTSKYLGAHLLVYDGGTPQTSGIADKTIHIKTGCPLGSIGDYVWNDADWARDQDATEQPIPQIEVRLLRDNGDGTTTILDTHTTDGNGWYLFDNLAAGNYIVDVDEYDAYELHGWMLTTENNPLPVNLGVGQQYRDADFGFAGVLPNEVALGDYVWYDKANLGVQDFNTGNAETEERPDSGGLQCITVRLYRTVNSVETEIGVANTNSFGLYHFVRLPAGTYTVKVDQNDPDLSQLIGWTNPPAATRPCTLVTPVIPAAAALTMSPDGPTTPGTVGPYYLPPGTANWTYDFGFSATPTAVSLQAFGGTALPLASVEVLVAAAGALVAGALAWRRRR